MTAHWPQTAPVTGSEAAGSGSTSARNERDVKVRRSDGRWQPVGPSADQCEAPQAADAGAHLVAQETGPIPSRQGVVETLLKATADCDGRGPHADHVCLEMTWGQAVQLAQHLGWLPTPNLADLVDAEGGLSCPWCRTEDQGLVVETRAPTCRFPVTGLVGGRALAVDREVVWGPRAAALNQEWLCCPTCSVRFLLPHGLCVDWAGGRPMA